MKTKKSTRVVGGHKVTIIDHGTGGSARFAAYYDVLPATVVGRGATRNEAVSDLERAATVYGERRQREIADQDWADHEEEKEAALKRDEY